jgi:hypothetical protein
LSFLFSANNSGSLPYIILPVCLRKIVSNRLSAIKNNSILKIKHFEPIILSLENAKSKGIKKHITGYYLFRNPIQQVVYQLKT